MADKGFAIRCPHCAKWNQWTAIDPETVAVVHAEFDEILTGLRQASEAGKPWDYEHRKLIRCTRPRWSCPSSFESIVFRSREEMKECLREVPEEWPFKRDFRLYRANCRDRWEDQYWAIMFCTPPFRRMRDIEFESLMDRELLSRLIVGMSVEINSVLTIFGANVFEPLGKKPEVFWMPIEAYSLEERLTPPRFNKLCECIRRIEMEELVKEFESNNYNVDKCPIIGFGKNGKCADKESPACMREPVRDWCHCPAFMKERKIRSLCYGSDLALIEKVAASEPEEAIKNGIEHICPVGFTEFGFPIMVHDHLVGVVMIGQVFSKSEEIKDIRELVSGYAILDGSEDYLKEVKKDLIREEGELRRGKEPRFFVNEDEVQQRIMLLRPNIERITEMANARYRDIRRRSESVFREELLEYFQKHKSETDFFDRAMPQILKRMREFWAFKAVYLVAYSYTSKDISILAMSSTSKGETPFGVPGKKVGRADPVYRQTHPIRYVHRRSASQDGLDPLVKDLLLVFDEVSKKDEFSIEGSDTLDANHLFILVPFYNEVYAFIFSVRDAKGLCRLERPARGDVSELCQEIILRVCTEVVYEFGDVWYREASMQRIKLDAWRSFSARTAHKINSRLFAARGVLRRQREANPEFVGIEELESTLQKIGLICADFIRFITDQPLNLQEIDVGDLLHKEVSLYKQAAPDRQIDFTISGSLPLCRWDPVQIGQAITELLENAINYSPAEAIISISAEHFERNHMDMIRIITHNDGKGVDHTMKIRIFEPFFSMRPERIGLGLAIVSGIVESHGGTVSEIGDPGKNAKFVIELPVQAVKELQS